LSSRKKREPQARKAKYRPTLREQTAIAEHVARRAAETPAPRLKMLKGEQVQTISPDHPDEVVASALLMEALGTADYDFGRGLLHQLVDAGSQGCKGIPSDDR
jgi:hypothetical protein